MDSKMIITLYVDEKLTLREIARRMNTNHHAIKRVLVKNGVEITSNGRRRKSLTEEHKRKISEKLKGRKCYWSSHNVTTEMRYKNMLSHFHWDVSMDFLLQFEDIEKLKELNRMLFRKRVSQYFDTEKYMRFVEKFYDDDLFNQCYKEYKTTHNRYDRPSLDHIVPLSRGGSWDLSNLQIISWFENRSKCDLTKEEYEKFKEKYWR